MVTNDQQLRLLLRSRLQVTVVDMNGEEAEDAGEGLIGKYCTCCTECLVVCSVFSFLFFLKSLAFHHKHFNTIILTSKITLLSQLNYQQTFSISNALSEIR
jgi:hypothetical protein